MNYKDFFKAKKIAVIGLGPHGEMVADVKFLLRLGATISLYDIRSGAKMKKFIPALEEVGLTKYVFGKVSADELLESELIILSPEISRKALFLKKATEAGITVEYPDVLFLKLAPSITLIGVMGACGKSTVSHLVYSMLKKSFSLDEKYKDQGLFFVDPDASNGALTHLKKIKAGDVVLARIPEEMMPEYHNAHISPHVAVITSLTSEASQEVRGAFDILEYQTYNNFIVAPDDVVDVIKKEVASKPKIKILAKILRTKADNAALALQTSELFKVDSEIAQGIIHSFLGLKARLEMIKKSGNIEFYNDATSITPHATLYALRKLSVEKNVILILGGAYTGYDYKKLINEIPLHAKMIILLPGSGTIGIRDAIEKISDIVYKQAQTLEDAVILAKEHAKKGDKILFSPGCEALGIDMSRRERGERFVKAVRSL